MSCTWCFFETVSSKDLVSKTFLQILENELHEKEITDNVKIKLKKFFSEESMFNRNVNLDNASLKVKFRTVTRVKPEGNILNSNQYPEISDNTLNLLCPFYSEDEKQNLISKMELAVGKEQLKEIKIFPIKHPLNGWFLVFQVNL